MDPVLAIPLCSWSAFVFILKLFTIREEANDLGPPSVEKLSIFLAHQAARSGLLFTKSMLQGWGLAHLWAVRLGAQERQGFCSFTA
jgi:hypothetical protein